MRRLFVIVALLALPMSGIAQGVGEKINALIKVPPKEAAARAFATGDKKYLLVPDCVEMLPGYPVGPSPTSAPLGKGETKIAGPSCEELLGSKLFAQVLALRQYAEEYNRHLYDLVAKPITKK